MSLGFHILKHYDTPLMDHGVSVYAQHGNEEWMREEPREADGIFSF